MLSEITDWMSEVNWQIFLRLQATPTGKVWWLLNQHFTTVWPKHPSDFPPLQNSNIVVQSVLSHTFLGFLFLFNCLTF